MHAVGAVRGEQKPPLLRDHPPRLLGLVKPSRFNPRSAVGRWLGRKLGRRSQRAAQREHYRLRCDLLRLDETLEAPLAFSGVGE